jgi:hypothetical protein
MRLRQTFLRWHAIWTFQFIFIFFACNLDALKEYMSSSRNVNIGMAKVYDTFVKKRKKVDINYSLYNI